MDILTVVAGALVANLLTIAIIVLSRRLDRVGAERDYKGIAAAIMVFGAIAAIGLAASP